MVKRAVIGLLWFVATWCAYELAIYFAGGPRSIGPVLAIAVAAFVSFDPAHLFWRSASPRDRQTVPPPSLSAISTD